jgi:hypothetical protein
MRMTPRYATWERNEAWMVGLVEEFGSVARLVTIGTTLLGAPIHGVEVNTANEVTPGVGLRSFVRACARVLCSCIVLANVGCTTVLLCSCTQRRFFGMTVFVLGGGGRLVYPRDPLHRPLYSPRCVWSR